ncbi:hypothetical protein [Nocardia sp. NPDC004604]|uniref:hypothetical protein n=1 Tax=Nocardia sp. NPDC004604 TaxID=3157013 RepID=UPI0033AE4902
MSARHGLDIALAHWLAAREITARKRAGIPVPERLRIHAATLAGLLESAAGLDDNAPGASSSSSKQAIDYLTAAQAGAVLGVTPRQARRLGARIGGQLVAGRWVFDPDALTEHTEGKTP